MTHNFLRRGGAVLALVALPAIWQGALAVPVPAWTIDSPSSFSNGSWSFGDIFTVGGSNIYVVGLGAFDADLNGFATAGAAFQWGSSANPTVLCLHRPPC